MMKPTSTRAATDAELRILPGEVQRVNMTVGASEIVECPRCGKQFDKRNYVQVRLDDESVESHLFYADMCLACGRRAVTENPKLVLKNGHDIN